MPSYQDTTQALPEPESYMLKNKISLFLGI